MKNAILVINAGSSSIKFAIFALDGSDAAERSLYGQISGINGESCFVTNGPDAAVIFDKPVSVEDHKTALRIILKWLEEYREEFCFIAAGHRVVHGGGDLTHPTVINMDINKRLEELSRLAPLHQPHAIQAITALTEAQPELTQVACFDTAFHATIGEIESSFALPYELRESGIRRYGFHGLSYESINDVLPAYLNEKANGRVVIAHLGHGVSMCAVKEGKSAATTMTFTPLDGLPMSTRCGALDPGVILYLIQEQGMDADSLSDLLYHRSGLLGVSGISGDMRELITSSSIRAQQAIDLFVHRIHRELGSLAAVLKGLDALVFTGGIGEHAPSIRERICAAAAWLGIRLDKDANDNSEYQISDPDSNVSVWVIPTDEERVIARHTLTLISERQH